MVQRTSRRSHKLSCINELSDAWQDCASCPLHAGRTNLVIWRGSLDAKVMLIGEAPGADEDATGVPFVGRCGVLLDDLLSDAGYNHWSFFIANMVACRPPNNRKPEREEIKACSPRLRYMIRLIDPMVIVLVGAVAAKMAGALQITKWRGEILEVDILQRSGKIKSYPAIPTFHPSYLLRNGSSTDLRDKVVADLKKARGLAYEHKKQ